LRRAATAAHAAGIEHAAPRNRQTAASSYSKASMIEATYAYVSPAAALFDPAPATNASAQPTPVGPAVELARLLRLPDEEFDVMARARVELLHRRLWLLDTVYHGDVEGAFA
jgi:hypothetical protein